MKKILIIFGIIIWSLTNFCNEKEKVDPILKFKIEKKDNNNILIKIEERKNEKNFEKEKNKNNESKQKEKINKENKK